MDKRGRYVCSFAILWAIYLLFNHEFTQKYLDRIHNTLLHYGFFTGRILGQVLLVTFLALFFGTVAIHYGDNVYQFVKTKVQARRRKEEELDRARQAKIEQAQKELEARRKAELAARQAWEQEEDKAQREAAGMSSPTLPVVDNGADGTPITAQQQWLKKMQDAIANSAQAVTLSNSSSTAALTDLGSEGGSEGDSGREGGSKAAAERHQQWLHRMPATTNTAAALTGLGSEGGSESDSGREGGSQAAAERHQQWLQRMQAAASTAAAGQQSEDEKQRALQALDAKLAKLKEGKKARQEELDRLRALAVEKEEQDKQARNAIDADRRLRADQDREYQESIERDRQREGERKRLNEQLEEQKHKVAELQALKAALRNELKEEPAAGVSGVISIRVRLPEGSSDTRRFTDDTPIKDVKNWVQSLEPFPLWSPQDWQLVNSYPRVALDEGLDLGTIADGCSSISLYVERL